MWQACRRVQFGTPVVEAASVFGRPSLCIARMNRLIHASALGCASQRNGGTGGDFTPSVDDLLEQSDREWRIPDDPNHMKGILQMLRYCHTITRSLPKALTLRFVLAKDEASGKRWVIPDAHAVYPGRGMNVVPSHSSIKQASNWLKGGFKTRNVHVPDTFTSLVEAQLLRHTQHMVLDACASATSAKWLPSQLFERSENGRKDENRAECSFLAALDGAMTAAIRKHGRCTSEVDTNVKNTTPWVIFLNEDEADDDLLYLSEKDEFRHYRVLHSLNASEFKVALSNEFAESDARPTEHLSDVKAILLDCVSKIQSDVSQGDAILLEGVDKVTSLKLQYAQLRLHMYRSSSRAADPASTMRETPKRTRRKREDDLLNS